ncbi:MAG: class I tRNA ligase family protein, partial [Patescibacteria group bacterium]
MKKYDHKSVESKWQKQWLEEKIYEPSFAPPSPEATEGRSKATRGKPDLKSAKKPFYNLMMFPYPSAEGLHVGNMYAFTGSDIYGRFKRMQGNDVFEPIGLDGFGIHSENYALKIGKHPADQAKISEKNFYRQLSMIGNGFAWNEKLETYDPEYYKWTQWIFIQLYKNGLAYRKKSAVNWCPSCLTVLADEQAVSGECERCGTKVIKKELEQWFFRITKYADKLLKGLGPVRSSLAEVQRTRDGIASETSNGIDWSEKVKIAQRNWIGRSEGATIKFPIVIPAQAGIQVKESGSRIKSGMTESIEVFTTRPDTLFGATFMAISVELAKKWIEEGWQAGEEVREYIKNNITPTLYEGRGPEKTGVFTGLNAINPANNKEIPIWVADYVLSGYGSGAVMCVPAHDNRDWEFAVKYQLPIIEVIKPSGDDKIRSTKSEIRNKSSSYAEASEDKQTQNSNVQNGAYEGEGILINSGKFDGMDSEKAKWEITKLVGGEKKIQYRLRDWLISRQRYWGPPIPMIYCPSCAEASKGKENAGWQAVPEKDLPVELPYIKEFRPTGTDQSPLASDEKFYKTKCPKCGGTAKRETDVSDTFLDSAWYYIGYLMLKNPKPEIPPLRQGFEGQANPKQIT